jgi:phosphate transport system substrate-binding protein
MRRRISGLLMTVLCLTAVSCSDVKTGDSKRVTTRLDGAGASFPAPLYKKWFEKYHETHPEVKISYDGVGSGAGIQLFTEGVVDFGASDAGMTGDQIKKVKSGGVQLIPTTVGMVALAYNLPDLSQPLKLSRENYTDICLGKITSWDDPKIKETNPDVTLPSTNITFVYRLGASGTTHTFTKHLSSISDDWNKAHAHGLTVDWPAGKGVIGTDGVASFIQQTPGAIGYLDFGTAKQNQLKMASLQNKAGEFVEPSIEHCQAAIESTKLPDDMQVSVPDPEGKLSYPIVTFTWILAHTKYDDSRTGNALKEFLTFALTEGQKECTTMGYVQLPEEIRKAVLESLKRIGS